MVGAPPAPAADTAALARAVITSQTAATSPQGLGASFFKLAPSGSGSCYPLLDDHMDSRSTCGSEVESSCRSCSPAVQEMVNHGWEEAWAPLGRAGSVLTASALAAAGALNQEP